MNSTERLQIPVITYDHLFTVGADEMIEANSNPDLESSKFNYHAFLANGMHLMRLTGVSEAQSSFAFKSAQPYISLVFAFRSSGTFISRHNNKIFADIRNNQAGIIFINNQLFESHVSMEEGGELYVMNVTTAYFERFLTPANPLYETFHVSLEENLPVLLNEKTIQVAARMKLLLCDIFQSEHKNYYKYLYLRSRMIELLLQLFQEYEILCRKQPDLFVSDSNLEKMYEVKDIIDSNITRSCTLLDLAQQVGTNECYLKKHFKQVFGTTVFGYVNAQRMLRSKELLTNEDMKIAEVAKRVGYKHASHFTTAFKKYFGYLPHQIKMLMLLLAGSDKYGGNPFSGITAWIECL